MEDSDNLWWKMDAEINKPLPDENLCVAHLQMRQIRQEDESVDDFMNNCRRAVNKCDFSNEEARDECLLEQLINLTAHPEGIERIAAKRSDS